MHPEENAGSIKAAFVFDMHSGSIGKAVAVLNQINTAIIPQVVSDSASTNMEQIPSGKNILWFQLQIQKEMNMSIKLIFIHFR